MKQAEFAALHNVSRKTVTMWKQRGLLVLSSDGMLDVEASNARLSERPETYRGGVTSGPRAAVTPPDGNKASKRTAPEPSKPASVPPKKPAARPAPQVLAEETAEEAVERILTATGATMNLAEATRVKENYIALLRQLEYDRESGAVIAIEDAVREYVARISRLRTRFLAIPSKVAGRIAVLRSPEEVQAFLDEEFALVLMELSGDADGLTRFGKVPKRAD